MYFRIVLTPHLPLDVRGAALCSAAPTLDVHSLRAARVSELYFIQGGLSVDQLNQLVALTLSDPAAHTITIGQAAALSATDSFRSAHSVEVAYLPGVMDTLALQLTRAAAQLGLPTITVATGMRYELAGALTTAELLRLTERLLCNATVQRYALGTIEPQFSSGTRITPRVEPIPLDDLDASGLVALSKARLLSLSIEEMTAVQQYYGALGRAPTDVELETIAQTWSEHCVHKTFKAIIDYTDADGPTETIDGLLNSTIRRATEEINAPWVRSAFVDNAGIIAFDEHWDLSIKVETHNHPSALEPFGGANTGVGGVIRDIMGVSARPIAVTDVLCFGPQDLPFDQLPTGTLHPRRVKEGVVSGIQDYGNKLGLPTVAGAVIYDPGYTANPLVFCGCVGIAPRGSHPTNAQIGDYIVVVGGRTGRDGLHGATFSSDALAHDTGTVAGTAVQIGNPITQKDVLEVIVLARDRKLYHAITDCGAGGLSSAVGEMAYLTGGVEVDLATVPLKYPGLQPWEIWLSEAQERMVLAVAPVQWATFQQLCSMWDVEATRIGQFTASGQLTIRYAGQTVADLSLAFMKDGLPSLHLTAIAPQPVDPPSVVRSGESPAETLLRLLSDPNNASKEDIIRRFDHEVRGGTVIKPMTGDGPSDGVVLKPIETPEHMAGFVLGVGVSLDAVRHDPIAEAINNIIAAGANPNQIALLDNFCWGDPRDPEQLGALVAASKEIAVSAIARRAPFVSGKDSLNNVYVGLDGVRRNIPGIVVITAIGYIPDVTKAITMSLKQPGNRLYLYHILDFEQYEQLHQAMQAGLIWACHDVSEGGPGAAIAEMCIAGQLGARVGLPPPSRAWFMEQPLDTFIVEVADEGQFSKVQPYPTLLGEVTSEPRFTLSTSVEQSPVIDLPISELTAAFKREGKYAL